MSLPLATKTQCLHEEESGVVCVSPSTHQVRGCFTGMRASTGRFCVLCVAGCIKHSCLLLYLFSTSSLTPHCLFSPCPSLYSCLSCLSCLLVPPPSFPPPRCVAALYRVADLCLFPYGGVFRGVTGPPGSRWTLRWWGGAAGSSITWSLAGRTSGPPCTTCT